MLCTALLLAAALWTTASAAPAQAPQHLTVPATHTTTDAPSQLWIPGANNPVRQQTIVGATHLQAVLGHAILAIELRRTAKNRAFPGGTANLTVILSTSPRQPLAIARTFADNVGGDAVVVWPRRSCRCPAIRGCSG